MIWLDGRVVMRPAKRLRRFDSGFSLQYLIIINYIMSEKENFFNLAIFGYGFVGKAVDNAFDNADMSKYIIDPKLSTSIDDIKDKDIDLCMICVPTPMGNDGYIDSKILTSVVEQVANFLPQAIICIKSTVLPDTLDRLDSISKK